MTTPEGEVEGPLDPVPGGQPEGEPQPWMPMPGTYGSRNAGRRQSILESFGQVVTRPILKDALEAADSEFQLALAAGRALVDEAQQHADDALGAVANAGSIMDTIQGTGADVVAKHTEVLTLHGQAITAAANSASDAALAAAKSLEASGHAADALVLFEAQQIQIDEEQNARLDLHQQVIDAIRGVEGSGLVAHRGDLIKSSTNAVSDNYFSIGSGAALTQTFTALGTWTGSVIAELANSASEATGSPRKTQYQIPQSGGSRTINMTAPTGSATTGFNYLHLSYTVNPGTQKSRDLNDGSFAVAQESWTTVSTHTWTVPAGATRLAVWFKAGWDAAPYLPSYGVRILVNGTPVKTWGPKPNLGPLVGNSYRHAIVSANPSIAAGSTVTFQVWTNASIAHERVVRDTETRISWIE